MRIASEQLFFKAKKYSCWDALFLIFHDTIVGNYIE